MVKVESRSSSCNHVGSKAHETAFINLAQEILDLSQSFGWQWEFLQVKWQNTIRVSFIQFFFNSTILLLSVSTGSRFLRGRRRRRKPNGEQTGHPEQPGFTVSYYDCLFLSGHVNHAMMAWTVNTHTTELLKM